jgi:hypothetical protein
MSLRLRRIIAFPLMALLASFAAGCGGKDKNNSTEDLSAEIANDVAASFGAMLATDNGGWMTEVKTSFDTTPRLTTGPGNDRIAGGASRDTSFTRGSMSWTFDYTFYDGLGTPSETYSVLTERAAVVCNATGNVPLSGGSTHVYVHRDTVSVDNMQDTLVTYGAISHIDTAFVTIGSKYYFFDNLVEYTLDMSQHPVTAWPVGGDATIDAFVDALRTPSRTDRSNSYDVTMTIAFDGTQTPLATVHKNVETPVSFYSYRINLRTGVATLQAAAPAAGMRTRGRIVATR